MIALLLQSGADSNAATLDVPKQFSRPVNGMDFAPGTTPLILAAFFSSVESVEMLLKAKANADHRDKQGRTALWHAEHRIFQQSKTRLPDVEKIRRLLLQAGAKPHSRDLSGLTARQTAATAWARP